MKYVLLDWVINLKVDVLIKIVRFFFQRGVVNKLFSAKRIYLPVGPKSSFDNIT